MSDKTIDLIRNAAMEIFIEKGYSASMKDIANTAGVTAPAIYVYYESKDKLFLEVIDFCLDLYTKHLRNDFNQIGDIYDEQQLFRFLKLRIQSFINNLGLYKFLLKISILPIESCSETITNKLRNSAHANIKNYNKMYIDLVDRKVIKPIGVELFARSLHRFINGIFFDTVAFQYPLDEVTLAALWNFYWEGVKMR